MSFLITGSAGVIGNALALELLKAGEKVVGIDSLNDYYDVSLKKNRLDMLTVYRGYKNYTFDITDEDNLEKVFHRHNPRYVIHLAAQAGVRYSI